MVRAFSQPINPRWMTGGDLAKKYIGRSAASAEKLARRAEMCALNWAEIHWNIRRAVRDVADGVSTYPFSGARSRVSNWASLKKTPEKNPLGRYYGGDWMFEDSNLRPGHVICEVVKDDNQIRL